MVKPVDALYSLLPGEVLSALVHLPFCPRTGPPRFPSPTGRRCLSPNLSPVTLTIKINRRLSTFFVGFLFFSGPRPAVGTTSKPAVSVSTGRDPSSGSTRAAGGHALGVFLGSIVSRAFTRSASRRFYAAIPLTSQSGARIGPMEAKFPDGIHANWCHSTRIPVERISVDGFLESSITRLGAFG